MKAAVFQGIEKIEIQDRNIPEPGPEEVLIQVYACGVCGTDVHIYRGEKGSAEVFPPVVLGHEFSGVIVKTGERVTRLAAGDHVAVDPNIYCGECAMCRGGKKNLCENLKANGVTMDGGFAEYCLAAEAQCYKLAEDVNLLNAAMAEPLSCCLHGIEKAGIRHGDAVCIIGGGAIGLIMLQLARLAGAGSVTVSEPVAIRREMAGKLGADFLIDPAREPVREAYLRNTGKDGADVVIECAGAQVAVKQMFQVAGKGARLLLFGVPAPDACASLPLFELYQKEWVICSSFINPDTFARAVELINHKRIGFDGIITHIYGVEELEQAILTQTGGEAVKTVVCFSHEDRFAKSRQDEREMHLGANS